MVAARLALCLALLGGCSVVQADLPTVPPVRAEQVPTPPVSQTTLIWQPGHYDWTGTSYIWIPGAWVERAGQGTLWQDGYWRRVNGQPVWVPAHWI